MVSKLPSWHQISKSTYRNILPFLPSTALDLCQFFHCKRLARREIASVDLGIDLNPGVLRNHIYRLSLSVFFSGLSDKAQAYLLELEFVQES